MIYGEHLPMSSLPKELHQTYGSEIASGSAVFRRDSESLIIAFLPIFNGWVTSNGVTTPTWVTHSYHWRLLSGIWNISPKHQVLDEILLPNIQN